MAMQADFRYSRSMFRMAKRLVWLLVVVTIFYYGYHFWQKKQLANQPYPVAVLGDSLAAGTGASDSLHNLGVQLSALIQTHYFQVSVTTLGVSGARVADVISDQLPKVQQTDTRLVVVVVGANDITHATDALAFRDSWETLLTRLTAPHRQVIVLTIPKITVSPLVPSEAAGLANERVQQFNAVITTIAKKHRDVTVVDLYQLSEKEFTPTSNLLSNDKFHPNDAGYAKIAEAVAKEVR